LTAEVFMEVPDALASAAAGMIAQRDRLDVIAENLANAATPGYRPQHVLETGFGQQFESAAAISDAQDPLRRTGVPTDLALQGPGYFSLAGSNGVEYTRDGRMTLDESGFLCDSRGRRVLGSLGPVRMPRGASIQSDGRVVADGHVIDRLRVVELVGGSVRRAKASVRAGYLEESGVEPIREMTALVGAERAYEANQKAAERADESLRRATNDVPAVVRS
jgi:flagellar basal-body rod protein FlgF